MKVFHYYHKNLNLMIFKIFLILFIGILFNSCATVDCPRCEDNANITQNIIRLDSIYIVEFKDGKQSKIENRVVNTIKSCTRPVLEKNDDGTYFFTLVEINKKNSNKLAPFHTDYKFKRISDEDYIKLTNDYVNRYSNRFLLNDLSEIKIISMAADVDIPPSVINIDPGKFCVCCLRDRECISEKTIFDKIELRAMGGYRLNANESILYPGENGGTVYNKEAFGFERGGTDFIVGLESAFLWDITGFARKIVNIPRRNRLHIGPMIGVWPVDESIFIPVSLHPRYTFSYDETDPVRDQCNAWYVFGDLGIPIDPTMNVPIMCDGGNCNDLMAYFYGFGVGRDWWMNRCMDFSVDMGFRVTNTPLPAYEECEKCTGHNNQHPYRKIGQIYIRFGLTW